MTLNKEQQRVYDWLKQELSLPVFGNAYKGAILFLNQESDGYITFVSHTGRDLMNALASTYKGVEGGRVQYPDLVDGIKDVWKSEWRDHGIESSTDEKSGHLIPYQACQKITDLIDKHESGRSRNSDADSLFFSTFLDYSIKDKIPGNFLKDWKSAKRWFVAHAHLRKGDFSKDEKIDLAKYFSNLHSFLYVAASSQYERIRN
ncbi:MAG: hypothetical protein DU481_06115 [Nitrosomonas sp.]|uniref:hypothetical protein n=1 Tax=Nitrosomonas sp. TaxID=42353 RepID=UPI0032EB31FA